MKAYRREELNALTDEELANRERQLRESLFKIRMKLAVGQMSKVADIEATRRNLARVMTAKRARQIAAAKA